jgi:hypothetical protein
MDKKTKYALLGIITESLTKVPTNLNIALSAQFAASLSEILIPSLNEFYDLKADVPEEPSIKIKPGNIHKQWRNATKNLPKTPIINNEPADAEECAPPPEAPADAVSAPENLGALITWAQKAVDESKYYCVRYSNPCTTLHGKSGACAQTESVWNKIGSKNPDDFLIVDYEARTAEDLKRYFDEKIEGGKQYAGGDAWVDPVNDAMESQNAELKATLSRNKKNLQRVLPQDDPDLSGLSKSQLAVYQLFYAKGLTQKECAESLKITPSAVYQQLKVIRAKLGIK